MANTVNTAALNSNIEMKNQLISGKPQVGNPEAIKSPRDLLKADGVLFRLHNTLVTLLKGSGIVHTVSNDGLSEYTTNTMLNIVALS